MTPDGRTLFVASQDSGTVTPVSIPAGIPGTPIKAGPSPQALAVTPDGRTLYVADSGYVGVPGGSRPLTSPPASPAG